MGDSKKPLDNLSHVLYDRFIQATTCKATFHGFQELCKNLDLEIPDYPNFFTKLKAKLNYWKAKAIFAKLDKRASHKDYKKGNACADTKCMVIGAGPCGLRIAIELAFLGAKVILVEKRDTFSRNNVLHLWPYTIVDLRNLGAKKIYGKFCAGAIDHISIRQLQLVLLKLALIMGIEIHLNIEFRGLIPPRGTGNTRDIKHVGGWEGLLGCVREREREREMFSVCGGLCVCVCVCRGGSLCVSVCVCGRGGSVCVEGGYVCVERDSVGGGGHLCVEGGTVCVCVW
uniref:Protein-methionine sulfoxide oxidase MICAL3-like n=1 Tax=Callorhinchus milii TaxID=7868 RepID=A0A4W3HLN0_CALMI